MSDLLEQEINDVRNLRDNEELSWVEIGKRLGFSEKTARRRYASGEIADAETMEDFPPVNLEHIVVKSDYIPEDKGPIERFEPLSRYGDAMVTCDWHIPLHDPEMVNKMVRIAKFNNLDKLIIAGDYFHMETFSSFLPFQPEASLIQEKFDGNLIMKTLLRTFDEIDIFWGNHDFRLVKKLGFKKSFEECIHWMLSELTDNERERIRISELDYMHYYPGDGRKYRICHPRNFSSVPLTVPRKLAQKHSCSIITAHSHHCAIGAAPNGKDVVIEGGGFFAKERTEYIQKSTGNHEWVQGFTTFIDGTPTLYSPLFGNL